MRNEKMPPKDYAHDDFMDKLAEDHEPMSKNILKCVFSLDTLIMTVIITGTFMVGVEVIRAWLN